MHKDILALTKNEQKKLVGEFPKLIGEYVFSNSVVKTALRDNPNNLRYIKSPSNNIILYALSLEGMVIRWVTDPTYKMISTALKSNPKSVMYIDLSESDQLSLVKHYRWVAKYIKNPCEVVEQITKVQQNPESIRLIDSPHEMVQYAAVTNSWKSIKGIQNPSANIQRVAINESLCAMRHIKNIDLEVFREIAEYYVTAINYISNPSEEMAIIAVRANRNALALIKNPTIATVLCA